MRRRPSTIRAIDHAIRQWEAAGLVQSQRATAAFLWWSLGFALVALLIAALVGWLEQDRDDGAGAPAGVEASQHGDAHAQREVRDVGHAAESAAAPGGNHEAQ